MPTIGRMNRLEDIRRDMTRQFASPSFVPHIQASVEGILRMIDAIRRTEGVGWVHEVVDAQGKPLLEEHEKKEFERAGEPLVPLILGFFSTKGGAEEIPTYEDIDVAALSRLTSEELDAKRGTIGTTSTPADPEKMIGVDNLYEKAMDRMDRVQAVVNEYASKYGILRLEKEYDLQPDIHLVPEVLAQLISKGTFALSTTLGAPILPQVTMKFLEQIKLPFRFLVFLGYLALDVARMSAYVAGEEQQRKMLSVVVSFVNI